MNSKNEVIYMGSKVGEKKSKDGNYYKLNFAVKYEEDSNTHGYDVCSIFVDKATFIQFEQKAKCNTRVNALVFYARGGWILADYNL